MYSLTLTVYNVLDLWVVSGSIREHDEDRNVGQVATFHESVTLPDAWLDEDATATMIQVVRQWADRTSRS